MVSSPRVLLQLLVVLSGVVLSACGLPSIPIIEPPVDPGYAEGTLNSPGQQVLRFYHNRDNDSDDFAGYDLYYKLYPPDGAGVASSLAADEDYIETTPKETGFGRLQERGFLRLVTVTNRDGNPDVVSNYITGDPVPHLPLDPTNSSVMFRLDIREPESRPEGSTDRTLKDAEIVVTWNGAANGRGFRRRNSANTATSQPAEVFESFWYASGYNDANGAADYDISRMFSSGTFNLDGDGGFGGDLIIVIYAITYGIDATTFQPYYSVPLRLPEATIVTSK